MADEDLQEIEGPHEARARAAQLYLEAKALAKREDFRATLKVIQEAHRVFPLEKYQKRIDDLQAYLEGIHVEDSDDDIQVMDEPVAGPSNRCTGMSSKSQWQDPSKGIKNKLRPKEEELSRRSPKVRNGSKFIHRMEATLEVVEGFFVREETYQKLYGYQKDGIKWLYKLYERQMGSILADDMGLGKTIQTIVFISTLLEREAIRTVLIIAPTTLLLNWAKEFKKWSPSTRVHEFHTGSTKRRLETLRHVQRHGGVLMTTYDLARNSQEDMSRDDWDYAILDEAHKIKNPTKTTKALHLIPAKIRLAITGTPLQNNLKELWALYDFVMKGCLLGTYKTFKDKYEQPILKAREKGAKSHEIARGKRIAESLRTIIAPYFLRRTKNEVFRQRTSIGGNLSLTMTLPQKFDWVVWIRMSAAQIKVYKDFLASDDVKQAIMEQNRSPLTQLVVLKKICDHPRLLSKGVCETLLYEQNLNISQEAAEDIVDNKMINIDNVKLEQLIEESGKLAFLVELLEQLKREGHRTLLFSQSTKMLDIIQMILVDRDWKLARLDGRVRKMTDRDQIVNTFQENQDISVCLLTTQVGGVGLTLTGADRVVIYDPSWNPATDSQAIDRAYRIGQEKPVFVYRLVTCGSVEEKIYRRQVFKDSITKQTVGKDEDPTRYFSCQELRELFVLDDPSSSKTHEQLEAMHGHQRMPSATADGHRSDVKQLSSIYDVSDHDLLYTFEEPAMVIDVDEDAINRDVTSARSQIERECDANVKYLKDSNRHFKPFDQKVPERILPNPPPVYDPLPNPTEVIDLVETSNHSTDCFDEIQLQDDNTMDALSQELEQSVIISEPGSYFSAQSEILVEPTGESYYFPEEIQSEISVDPNDESHLCPEEIQKDDAPEEDVKQTQEWEDAVNHLEKLKGVVEESFLGEASPNEKPTQDEDEMEDVEEIVHDITHDLIDSVSICDEKEESGGGDMSPQLDGSHTAGSAQLKSSLSSPRRSEALSTGVEESQVIGSVNEIQNGSRSTLFAYDNSSPVSAVTARSPVPLLEESSFTLFRDEECSDVSLQATERNVEDVDCAVHDVTHHLIDALDLYENGSLSTSQTSEACYFAAFRESEGHEDVEWAVNDVAHHLISALDSYVSQPSSPKTHSHVKSYSILVENSTEKSRSYSYDDDDSSLDMIETTQFPSPEPKQSDANHPQDKVKCHLSISNVQNISHLCDIQDKSNLMEITDHNMFKNTPGLEIKVSTESSERSALRILSNLSMAADRISFGHLNEINHSTPVKLSRDSEAKRKSPFEDENGLEFENSLSLVLGLAGRQQQNSSAPIPSDDSSMVIKRRPRKRVATRYFSDDSN